MQLQNYLVAKPPLYNEAFLEGEVYFPSTASLHKYDDMGDNLGKETYIPFIWTARYSVSQ